MGQRNKKSERVIVGRCMNFLHPELGRSQRVEGEGGSDMAPEPGPWVGTSGLAVGEEGDCLMEVGKAEEVDQEREEPQRCQD